MSFEEEKTKFFLLPNIAELKPNGNVRLKSSGKPIDMNGLTAWLVCCFHNHNKQYESHKYNSYVAFKVAYQG